MPRLSHSFRLQARNIFLTYPRCDIPKDEALQMLQALSWTVVQPTYIRVAREEHSDGHPHLHCLIQLSGKSNIRDARFFDLTHPRRSASFHPNVQAAKDTVAVRNYITKDGDYCESGQYKVSGGTKANKDDVFHNAVNAGGVSEALEIIRAGDPKTFIVQHHNIRSNLELIFKRAPEPWAPPFPLSSFTNVPEEMQEWADDYFGRSSAARPVRPISIIVEGDSRTGKTMWARALGPHNYLSGHLDFNSRVYSNQVEYNVIDDVSPQYLKLKHWKELIGAQKDWQSNCKYGKPVQIKGGIPSIVLCNPGEGASYKDFLEKQENSSLKAWTINNAKFIFLNSPLYQTTTQDCEEESNQATTN
ncbi:replication associated protein [Begomovirus abutilonbrazilense]|uniref:Replication-associated protein n=1 Tax=Begomovirus abutilonbrazilense TaxID=1046572 RepID=G9CM09_9GEMI|nr:AC1 gene product [Abutilon mosaic Brazil virus]AEI91412.1 replication associated protein [Abutilon mosaic Brazil virus]AEI91417.1 replication associated protein [Abutilon mosaic Brazil virus]AEI91422.1 replication associated protein [Abutilon mosaic Brazil virus]